LSLSVKDNKASIFAITYNLPVMQLMSFSLGVVKKGGTRCQPLIKEDALDSY